MSKIGGSNSKNTLLLLVLQDLFSSPMISRQSSTHSSQMKTVGPAISLRTSWHA